MSDVTIEDAATPATALPVLPHQNWFAVALSTEVPIGGVIGVPFAGGRLALFRPIDGSPVALSSRCAHMGADLAAGDARRRPTSLHVPPFLLRRGRSLHAGPFGRPHPVQRPGCTASPWPRALGLIWVFNGEATPSRPPGIPGYDPAALAVRARRTDFFEVDPWVIIANSFDFVHLATSTASSSTSTNRRSWGTAPSRVRDDVHHARRPRRAPAHPVSGTNRLLRDRRRHRRHRAVHLDAGGPPLAELLRRGHPQGPPGEWRNGCSCRSTSQTNC